MVIPGQSHSDTAPSCSAEVIDQGNISHKISNFETFAAVTTSTSGRESSQNGLETGAESGEEIGMDLNETHRTLEKLRMTLNEESAGNTNYEMAVVHDNR